MKKPSVLIFLSFFTSTIFAQNLVPNGDFEYFSVCPSGYSCVMCATPWTSANTYISPSYFNACAPLLSKVSVPHNCDSLLGYQVPRSGNGYAGINVYQNNVPYPIDYLQIELSDSLHSGKQYCLSYYANLWNQSKFGVDALGAYFSPIPIPNCSLFTCVLNYLPQVANPQGNLLMDTLNWMPLGGCFTAQGGERYLIIGNFTPFNQIQSASNNLNYLYSSYYYIDDVSLYEDTVLSASSIKIESTITISPNPAKDLITIYINGNEFPLLYSISNLTGKILKQDELIKQETLIDVSNLSAGIYFLQIKLLNGNSYCKKMVISVNN